MSLCIAFFQDNRILVNADSRVSVEGQDGRDYFVHDNYQKIRLVGNKVIFLGGNMEMTDVLFSQIKPNYSIKQIAAIAKNIYEQLAKKWGQQDLGAYIFTIEAGKAVVYELGSDRDFAIERTEKTGQHIWAVAARSDQAVPYILDICSRDPDKDMTDIIVETYEHFADELIGGHLQRYVVTPEGIGELPRIQLKDKKPLLMYNKKSYNKYHTTMDGLLFANKANIKGTVDCSELKINGVNVLTANDKIQADYIDVANLKAQYIQDDLYPNTMIHLNNNELIFERSDTLYAGIILGASDMTAHYRDSNYLKVSQAAGVQPLGNWDFTQALSLKGITGCNSNQAIKFQVYDGGLEFSLDGGAYTAVGGGGIAVAVFG